MNRKPTLLSDERVRQLARGQTITLPAGQALRLPAAAGHAPRRLHLLQGRLWLTCRGDLDDHHLESGAQWPLGEPGAVVIEAEPGQTVRLRLEPPPRPALIDAGLGLLEGLLRAGAARLRRRRTLRPLASRGAPSR